MKFRTLVVAAAVVGLSTVALAPANAVIQRASAHVAKVANPCSADPQSGSALRKKSGPGPQYDSGYSVVSGPSGDCVKVVSGQQDGTYSHVVVVKSQGRVQRTEFNRATSDTRTDRHNGSHCTVTVTVSIRHPGMHTGIYKGTIDLRDCAIHSA